MAERQGPLRQVAWLELFPWLLIFRSFQVALEARKVTLALIAVALTFGGWWLIGRMCLGAEAPTFAAQVVGSESEFRPLAAIGPGGNPALEPWRRLSEPIWLLFTPSIGPRQAIYALLALLWAILVWAPAAGILTRLAGLQLARDDASTIGEAFGYVRRNAFAYATAPLVPLVGIVMLTLPIAAVGLLMRFDLGVFLASLLWPMVLMGAIPLAVLVLGLLVGWPFMWTTISIERGDAFEAFSFGLGYVYQRPIRLLVYVAMAAGLGMLAMWVIFWLGSLVAGLSLWAASWGAGDEQIGRVLAQAPPRLQALAQPLGVFPAPTKPLVGISATGAKLIIAWLGFVYLVVLGFGYVYFWTAATAIYLVLRHDVEGTELDRIKLDEQTPVAPLPPLAPAPKANTLPIVDLSAVKPSPSADAPPTTSAPPSAVSPPVDTPVAPASESPTSGEPVPPPAASSAPESNDPPPPAAPV